ncbi:hypothetical protein JK163_13185 [Levilactobacillus brevis]|uniref:Uncharacterized protein n=1 Tax=Levilactobacillus brevis TaxID=1580 RepID=A0A1W6NKZ6_LEVBR|nr:hypothetical protein [Levilactobacillus brevis]ARN94032.1 hypothetical protein AZI11_14020 [Levilactobacillus brevis]ARN96639.1 hypothetical protein AZI12_14300 [Levilactobacillus brevis]MBS0948658.1 hypothetical protein [Levilactobacillus brevis]MBS1007190.1 hypothetical protein [Levilactobacillus brevis]MBS1011797.1 hypothetical protein [Levilactobacillus brevis]
MHQNRFINTDKPQNQSLLKRFSITSVPTIVRVNRDQKVIRYTGTDRTKIRKMMLGGRAND